MTPTAVALLGFAAWTLLLLIGVSATRIGVSIRTGKAANTFDPASGDLDGFAKRITRAHANCYENLPVAAAVLLYAVAADRTAVTDGLAYVFISARLLQSLVHLISTSNPAISIRFVFFLVQVGILIYWFAKLAGF